MNIVKVLSLSYHRLCILCMLKAAQKTPAIPHPENALLFVLALILVTFDLWYPATWVNTQIIYITFTPHNNFTEKKCMSLGSR